MTERKKHKYHNTMLEPGEYEMTKEELEEYRRCTTASDLANQYQNLATTFLQRAADARFDFWSLVRKRLIPKDHIIIVDRSSGRDVIIIREKTEPELAEDQKEIQRVMERERKNRVEISKEDEL